MTSGTPPSESVRPDASNAGIRGGLLVLVGVLVLQNALGIYVNLFVTLSLPPDLGSVTPVIFGNVVLATHAAVALVLIAGSVRMAVVPIARVGRAFRYVALLLVLDLAVTSYLGYHFVGTQENAFSFAMEMGFLAALVLVLWLRAILPPPVEVGASLATDTPKAPVVST